jgi:hypothetical protein
MGWVREKLLEFKNQQMQKWSNLPCWELLSELFQRFLVFKCFVVQHSFQKLIKQTLILFLRLLQLRFFGYFSKVSGLFSGFVSIGVHLGKQEQPVYSFNKERDAARCTHSCNRIVSDSVWVF